MRALVVIASLVASLLVSGSAAAQVASPPVTPDAWMRERFNTSVPLRNGGRAVIWFYRDAGAGTEPFWAAADDYYGCVQVYGRRERYWTPTQSCGVLEVAEYSFDLEMNQMRLVFDIPYMDPWQNVVPIGVSLRITGQGPIRRHLPQTTYQNGFGITQWSTRQAVTAGTIYVPGRRPSHIGHHSPRAGMLERRIETHPHGGYGGYPWYP